MSRSHLGALLLIGAIGTQVGFAISAADSAGTESAGDFFAVAGGVQFFIVPMVILAVLLAVAPRLFFRWGQTLSATGGVLVSAVGALVALSAIVFAGGGFITFIGRASDDDTGVGTGDWLAAGGATFGAFATLVFAIAGLLASRSTSSRMRPQPVL
jgi:hypothetical protein